MVESGKGGGADGAFVGAGINPGELFVSGTRCPCRGKIPPGRDGHGARTRSTESKREQEEK